MEQVLGWAFLEAGAAHCSATIEVNGGLLAALAVAGLLGSLGHCTAMCGPLALALVSLRLERIPAARLNERHRWLNALLISCHSGRITTYAGLGALAATVSAGVQSLPGFRWLGGALLLAAGLGFFLAGLDRWLGRSILPGWSVGSTLAALVVARARPLLVDGATTTGWRGYRLGLVLGFIPCGLLGAALAIAAASADPLAGGLGMIAFGLGTAPTLVAIGLAGHLAGQRVLPVMKRALPALLVLNGVVLTWLAWRTVAA